MRRLMLMLALLTVATAASAQTPCNLPEDTLAANPNRLFLYSPDHMSSFPVEGQPDQWIVQDYEVRYYPQGTPAPYAAFTYPRAAFTAVPDAPRCFSIAHSAWVMTPNVRYRAVVIAKTNPLAKDAAGNQIPDSPPSVESNPFWLPGPPRPSVISVR